jgi:hypothetical protein
MKGCPVPVDHSGHLPRPRRPRTARTDNDRLDFYRREFGYGRTVPISALRRLVRSRQLSASDRAGAAVLLGDVFSAREKYHLAIRAFARARRIAPDDQSIIMSSAACTAQAGVYIALSILSKLDARRLSRDDRSFYWIYCLDIANASLDTETLRAVLGRVPTAARKDHSVAAAYEVTSDLLDFIVKMTRQRAGRRR